MTQAKSEEWIPDNADSRDAPKSGDMTDERAFGELPFVKQLNKGVTVGINGDTQAAQAQVEAFGQQMASVALDPLGFLIGTGVEFIINFVTPVRDAIQLVTGDCDALRQSAEKFGGVQKSLDSFGDGLTQSLNSQLKAWQGQAKDAASEKLSTFVDGIKNTAKLSHNISELLSMSAIMMEAAEGVIKGILKDFIVWGITTWLTAIGLSGPTFGGSLAAATAATTAEAGITCARTAQQIQRIIKIIQTISDVIMAIKAVLDTIRIIDSVQDITSGKTNGGDADASAASKNLGRGKQQIDNANKAGGQYRDHYRSEAEKNEGKTVDKKGRVTDIDEDGNITKLKKNGDIDADADGNPKTYKKPTHYTAGQFGRSAATNTATQLGSAADALEAQAKKGGFSKVPPDKTISGELDF